MTVRPDSVNGRETLAELRALEAEVRAFRDLMDERDRRYTEGKENDQRAVSAALASAKEAVNAALTATKEASAEVKEGLKEYKAGANEWRATVTDLVSQLRELGGIKANIAALEEKIADLRESRSQVSGQDRQAAVAKVDVARWVGWLLAVVGLGWGILKP